MRRWWWTGALFVAGTAWGFAENFNEMEVLGGMETESRTLLQAITSLEQSNPLTVDDIDLHSPQTKPAKALLADLYRRTLQGDPPGSDVTFLRWPELFRQYVNQLRVQWEQGADKKTLQDSFYAAHLGYARSVVAANVLVELTKRRYTLVHNPAETELDRRRTKTGIESVHRTVQRCLRWMHTLRFDKRFWMLSVQSDLYAGAWETRWAKPLLYNGQSRFPNYNYWQQDLSIDWLLSPLEPVPPGYPSDLPQAGPVISPATAPKPVPAPDTPDVPPAVTPEPKPVPAPVAPKPGDLPSPPPVSTPIVDTRDRVARIIERLYSLLEKPEIQQSDEMKRLLEELIDQLKRERET
jgi:hypothetical protein